jgi:HSP20 family protein
MISWDRRNGPVNQAEEAIMRIVRWEPFREMEEFFRDYSPLFARNRRGVDANWTPSADISETDQEYLIKAGLPEVKKEDVKINLADGVLTISGERKRDKEEKDANEIRIESFYGTFSRSFSLPENVDTTGIRAESKDGVLKVHVPKTAPSTPKAIAIDVQ